MLRYLRIRNLAVIESAEIQFEPGFNVLTGETGAGKSILVDAIGLLLGARASADLVRTGEASARIEAVFEDDHGRERLITREVTSQGRSRSFVDGDLATAGALRDLSQSLVEIHGQHEHHALLDPLAHLPLLDGHAGLEAQVLAVERAWNGVRERRQQLDQARMDSRERTSRLDLVSFQLGEIRKVAPRAGEDDELAATRQVLASAERVERLCVEGYAHLYDGDQAALTGLAAVWKRVGELAEIDPAFGAFLDARDGIKAQLEDLAAFLQRYADGVDTSPERLQEVQTRLAALDTLKRKYGPTLQDVLDASTRLSAEHDRLAGGVERAEDVQRALTAAEAGYLDLARVLSAARQRAAPAFARALEGLLDTLAMARTRFEVRFAPELAPADWGPRGIDVAEFYVSPNPGEDLRPLARIASGGELSRIMLAVRTLSAGPPGRTLIFDEVDVGIGGRVAGVVGEALQDLGARGFQVLCITHLPQIAARGSAHFRIDKTVRGTRTVTSVERLTTADRVEEIARMLGGATGGESLRAGAKDLLAHASIRTADTKQRARAKDKQTAKGESESRRGA